MTTMDAAVDAEVECSREVRLGLVMYGGVSLAVYINGVARVFFDAVRGRGVFGLVKALTDSDIVVDVISGTSAGGINGIMLGYALCNEREFGATASLWRQHGGIESLLREPTDPNTSSVLDSENYFEPRLHDAFATMPPIGDPARLPFVEHVSPCSELDLFVTGTNVDGARYTRFDDAGHAIDVKEHRGVFLLKHRAGRKRVFEPGPTTHAALARLSRITSCFPGAFAPVKVSGAAGEADALLRRWGQLDADTWFLDGGVLDNKPFTLTLNAIFSRTADRDVDRRLFYVEPDPEIFEETTRRESPNVIQAVLSSLIGIPSYESISEDLQRLTDHNSKVQRYNRITQQLVDSAPPAEGNGPTAARLYAQARLTVISDRVIEGLFKVGGRARPLAPEESQKAAELVRDFDGAVRDPGPLFESVDVYYPVRRLYRLIYLIFGMLHRPDAAADPLPDEARQRYRDLWRVLNRQLKLYEILRARMEALVDELDIPWKDRRSLEIWNDVLCALGHLLATDPAHPFQNDVPTTLPETPEALTPEAWLPSSWLTAFNEALRARAEALTTSVLEGPSDTPNVLRQADAWDRALVEHYAPDPDDPVRRAFEHFDAIDEVLYPLETMSGVGEKDIIETIRISPRDAARGFSAGSLAAKVSGDSVYHFGGFFKRSWRANDILWGRLDGLCQLLEALVDVERLRHLVGAAERRARIRARLFEPEGPAGAAGEGGWWYAPGAGAPRLRRAYDPAQLFPRAGRRAQQDLHRWLAELVSEDAAHREQALAETPYMTTLLIEMAQLEVLSEELPNVIKDALDEQGEWNRYQVGTSAPPMTPGDPPWTFQAPDRPIDPFVAVVGSARHSQVALDSVFSRDADAATPLETPLGRFFQSRYGVGSEKLTRDIPSIVLLDVLASAVLVVRNCLLGAFPAEATRRIKGHALYKWTLDRPLRVFYGSVKILRRSPKAGALGAALAAVSAVVLAISILWFDRLACRPGSAFDPLDLCDAQGLDVASLLLLVALPAAILLVLAYVALKALVIRRMYRRYARWRAGRTPPQAPPATVTPQALAATLEALVDGLAGPPEQVQATLFRHADPLEVAEARRLGEALPAHTAERLLALRTALEVARQSAPVLEAGGLRARFPMPQGRPSLVFKRVEEAWYLMN